MRGRWTSCALLLAGLSACGERPAPHPMGDTNPQSELARTLGTIRTSTANQPKTLKILFYGQSISQPKWTDIAVAHLRATYPNTRFIVRNLAIGGFESTKLERTVERDIDEVYPDLIVFHAYGDHRAYERVIKAMRTRTAAEIIVQSDHVTVPVEPICRGGLHLTLRAPPGCKGFLWYRQNSWEEFFSGTAVPGIAWRYHLAVDPRRWGWNAYLKRHDLAIADLLADPPHPNDRGWALMARLFDAWFDKLVRDWTPHPQTLVWEQALPPGNSATLEVTGNRIELIASAPLDGKVAVLVDGKPPRDLDGCWQTGRTDMLPNVPYWPAIRRVTMSAAAHQPGRWTAILHDLSPDQTKFTFRLYGPNGADGQGDGMKDFVSPSGQVRIDARDWSIPAAMALKQQGVPEGYRIGWDRRFVCGDEPSTPLAPGRIEARHVIATGLANGPHRITLRLTPDARAAIGAVRTYRPPLAD
ncbi:hypothetical protein [Sphingomonas bacterium]|uniref:hypothetical protein n=1 Tax=Sphingomonas bacterium TaxID=1895847 RepID=UPI0015761ABE|nr:hypothetical protein [Sphingomonas bacterium]